MPGKPPIEKTVTCINKLRDGTVTLKHMAHKMISLVLHGTLKAIAEIGRKVFRAWRHGTNFIEA